MKIRAYRTTNTRRAGKTEHCTEDFKNLIVQQEQKKESFAKSNSKKREEEFKQSKRGNVVVPKYSEMQRCNSIEEATKWPEVIKRGDLGRRNSPYPMWRSISETRGKRLQRAEVSVQARDMSRRDIFKVLWRFSYGNP